MSGSCPWVPLQGLGLSRPVDRGYVVDWDLQREIWDHVFTIVLKVRALYKLMQNRSFCLSFIHRVLSVTASELSWWPFVASVCISDSTQRVQPGGDGARLQLPVHSEVYGRAGTPRLRLPILLPSPRPRHGAPLRGRCRVNNRIQYTPEQDFESQSCRPHCGAPVWGRPWGEQDDPRVHLQGSTPELCLALSHSFLLSCTVHAKMCASLAVPGVRVPHWCPCAMHRVHQRAPLCPAPVL